MVLKITELRSQYGVYPEFETEEERLAYEAERQAAYEELVAAKIAELKALYKSDTKKYSKFKNFTDDDWRTYAILCLQSKNARTTQTFYAGFLGTDKDPETAEWARYTYEEILQMEANGVVIPQKVLDWAHSMQDSDVTAYQIDDDSSADETTEEEYAPSSKLKEMQKKTQALSTECVNTQEELNHTFVEFEQTAKKAEDVKREFETSKTDSLKKIEDLTKEYDELVQKIKNGGQLDDSERKRYQELGSLLNGEDGELVTDVQASSAELEELMNSMDGLNTDIEDGIDLGDETVDMAKELAMYESGYKHKHAYHLPFGSLGLLGFPFASLGILGLVKDVFNSVQGQCIAKDALDNGNNLIEYANTLNSQLMMNQYVSLYEFATAFTASASETIGETKEVMGDDFNKSSKDFEEEGEVETEETEEDLNMSDLTAMGLGTRILTAKVRKVGDASEKAGKDALKELAKLGKKQTELANEKESLAAELEEAQTEIPETQSVESSMDSISIGESVQEDSSTEQSGLEGDIEEVDGEIETTNSQGLTTMEKLQKALKTNEKYAKFDNQADSVMETTTSAGVASTVYGGMLIVNGSTMIAAGVPLLSNFCTYAAGVALITQGTIVLTLGTGFVGIGADLIAIGVEGVDACDITGDKIDLSDENIQSVIDAFEEQEGVEEDSEEEGVEEEEQLSVAQGERAAMQAGGASLEEQARYFRGKSNEEAGHSLMALLQTKGIKSEAEIATKSAEATAKLIEFLMKSKKAEYDELEEKQEKAEEGKKEAEEAVNDPLKAQNIDTSDNDDFTEQDEKRLEKLGNELQDVGDAGQQRLYNSLVNIQGLEEFLADKTEIALTAEDYGQVAQIVGRELADSEKYYSIFTIYKLILALSAQAAGALAEDVGSALEGYVGTTKYAIEADKLKIQDAQSTIEDVTMSAAISPTVAQDGDDEENSEVEGDETTSAVSVGANEEEMADNVTDEAGVEGAVSSESSEGSSGSSEGSSDDDEVDINKLINDQSANETQTQDATKESNDYTDDAKKDAKDSQQVTKDAKKDEKTLDREGKNLIKLIEKDQQEVEKLTEESQNAVAEQEALVSEFEELQAQNDSLSAQQTSQPSPAAPAQGQQQGGLLGQGNGLLAPQGGGNNQQTVVTISANQERMSQISERFNVLGKKVADNRVKMTTYQTSINSRVRKYQKIAQQKVKLQKAAQKAEEKKQQKMQKTLAALEVVSNIFSILGAIATLMQVLGLTHISIGSILIATGTPLLSNPFTAAAGAALVAEGTVEEVTGGTSEGGGISIAAYCAIGVAACQVAKSMVLLANGYSKEAFTTLGTAMISIAASIAGGGAAASGALQGISAGLTIVGSSADLAANIQTVQGKEQSEWLGTVSSVAGAAAGLTSTAGGLQGTFDAGSTASTFAKVTQVVGATGTTLTTSAQIASMCGADGKALNTISTIGGAMSTAAAAANVVGSATGLNSNKETRNANKQAKADQKAKKKAEKQQKAEDKANAKAEKQEQKKAAKQEKADAKAAEKAEKAEAKAQQEEAVKAEAAEQNQVSEKSETPDTEDVMQAIVSGDIKASDAADMLTNKSEIAQVDADAQQVASSETAQEIQGYDSNQPSENPETSTPSKDNTNETQVAAVQAEAQAAASELGNIEGMPSADEIAENPTHALAKLERAIYQAEQDVENSNVGRIDDVDLTISDEAQTGLDAKMSEAAQLESDENLELSGMSEYNATKQAEAQKTSKQLKRQQGFEKTQEVLGYVGQAASGGMQIAQAISSASASNDNTEQKNKVLNLSNLKKAKALLKKVKQRRQANTKAFNKYYA